MSGHALETSPEHHLTRIERALSYIHCHLDDPLSVQLLAAQSCWSRWQFQRVFTAATGFTVAQYIRELRLSHAAELLISTQKRQLDIALSCGFDSEISFSRSFRHMFGCAPGAYRRRGQRTRMLAAINLQEMPRLPSAMHKSMLSIRVEHQEAITVSGISAPIKGLFSQTPDFTTSVPDVWKRLMRTIQDHALEPAPSNLIGVLDLTQTDNSQESFPYWACFQTDLSPSCVGLKTLTIPAQDYAVIPHHGDISSLQKVLECFIVHWLPESGYCGVNGFDLEMYDRRFRPGSADCYMEYWVPVKPR